MSESIPPTSKQETLMQRLDRWRAGDGQLIGALIGDATDEIERLTRENEVWRKEVSATLGDNEILYTSQERLRAALAGLKDLTCGECVPCERINAEIDKALSGEPGAKRAYYETHDPPHCPTCGCGSAPETSARRPIDCKHERAKVQCPDCGIDFLGVIRTAPRDVPIWICSVCGGWNHVQDQFCTHTHAAQSAEKAKAE